MSACENAHSTADLVARRSYGKLVAFLAARTRDLAAAEDALSEAFAAALSDWPRNGCPQNPARKQPKRLKPEQEKRKFPIDVLD